jgi:hypothetical protein
MELDLNLTKHASVRQQQRGIPPIIIDLLQTHGTVERAGKDATTYYFDKASRRRVKAYFGRMGRAIDDFLDYYAVIGSNGQVITAAPRLGKVKHY